MVSWPSTCWLALVLILSGTPARQLEAASDLTRAMAGAADEEHIAEVDGGVGDDSLEATVSSHTLGDELARSVAFPLASFLGLDLARGEPTLAEAGLVAFPARAPESGWGGAARRQAWLGCFLF